MGRREQDARLQDLSPAAFDAREAHNAAVIARAEAIDAAALPASEALRLRVKYASHLGYSNTNKMATDLSKKLDVLGHRDPEAAQRLATQCSQLLSITTLLDHGQMEVMYLAYSYFSYSSL